MKQFALLILSALLYLSCLVSPAIRFEKVSDSSQPRGAGLWNTPKGDTQTSSGIDLLLLGVIGLLLLQKGAIGWLANPLYILALITALIKLTLLARLLIIAAIGFALVSLHLTNWYPLPADEGGVYRLSAIKPLLGHWLWLASMVTLAAQVWLP